MPSKSFTIKSTGQVVEIQYNWLWRNIVVMLEGREIGSFKSVGPLKEGQILKTPIGDIHVEYKQSLLYGSGFEVWYNGEILAGSLNDPAQNWRQGYKIAMFLGVLNIFLGAAAIYTRDSFLAAMGAGPYSLIFGIVLLLLGIYSWQRRSGTALAVAAFIFAADAILGFVLLLMAGAMPNIAPLFLRAAFVALMWRGAGAAEPEHEKVKNA